MIYMLFQCFSEDILGSGWIFSLGIYLLSLWWTLLGYDLNFYIHIMPSVIAFHDGSI